MRRPRITTLLLAAALGQMAGPAAAQFTPPGAGYAPYTFTAPEAATGVLGAGSAAGQTCYQQYYGRGGARTQCEPATPTPTPGKK